MMLQNLTRKHGTRVTGIDGEVLDLLQRSNWPGNVRELRNILERAAITAGEGFVRVKDMPSPGSAPVPGRIPGDGRGPILRPRDSRTLPPLRRCSM
jgi:DNA-binding NtrC family response regulator